MIRLLFINTLHNLLDDRTFYHHALSLSKENVEVNIFSTLEAKNEKRGNIQLISEKVCNKSILNQILTIHKTINQIKPSAIICDSPIGVISTSISRGKKTIIYDVTEWIPSKKNFKNTKTFLVPLKFFVLVLFNFLAGLFTNKFIFGEYRKSKIFKPFFWKKRIISSYYPDLKYIQHVEASDISQKVRLYYSGWFNTEKGFDKVLKLTELVAKLHTNLKIELQLTGSYDNEIDKQHFESIIKTLPQNVTVISSNFKSFEDFCSELKTVDIFLDLRKNDFENTRCLPIKLFYYLACGRPVVYTGLRAIKDVLNLSEVGYSFENNDIETVANGISKYLNNPEFYKQHCNKAKELSEQKFNWKKIETDFINFVLENPNCL